MPSIQSLRLKESRAAMRLSAVDELELWQLTSACFGTTGDFLFIQSAA